MGISSQPKSDCPRCKDVRGTVLFASFEAKRTVPLDSVCLFLSSQFCNFTKPAYYVTVVISMVGYVAVAAVLDTIWGVGEIAFTVFA